MPRSRAAVPGERPRVSTPSSPAALDSPIRSIAWAQFIDRKEVGTVTQHAEDQPCRILAIPCGVCGIQVAVACCDPNVAWGRVYCGDHSVIRNLGNASLRAVTLHADTP